jgi:putative DNA primase/helicase
MKNNELIEITVADSLIIEDVQSSGASIKYESNMNKRINKSSEAGGISLDPFSVDANGIWHTGLDQEGRRKAAEWVCGQLDVISRTRDQSGGGWGYLISFTDPLGRLKNWSIPARLLSGDGAEYRSNLLGLGLQISANIRTRSLLTQYIQTRKVENFAICTDRVGWHGQTFVMPDGVIGDPEETIVFQSDNPIGNIFALKGSSQKWREEVGRLCIGNSRLVFCVATGFAAPMLRLAGIESGGFHLRGTSSSGKTTALKVAASLYGGENYLQRWRATDSGLEALAAQHNDCLLILDELAQVDPKTAAESSYLLANAQGKARAHRTGTSRARQSWQLLFLSAGEVSLAEHVSESQKKVRAGQEVRMVDIPADAGAGAGAFECLHGFEGGAAFSYHLSQQSKKFYGSTGRAWLEWLSVNSDAAAVSIQDATKAIAKRMIPSGSSGQVERVADRFALVAAAGEMATEAGLTGWPTGECEKAALTCFNAWICARGGVGNGEVASMLRAVRKFLETHGEGRFTWWNRAADNENGKTINRAGFRRLVDSEGQPIKSKGASTDADNRKQIEDSSVEYFVMSETFRSEICQGFDYQAVCRVLIEHGCLLPDKTRPFDCKPRLPGLGSTYCYRISPKIFQLDI